MGDKNPDCQGILCIQHSEVRVLPAGGAGNLILCKTCFISEIAYRHKRNIGLEEWAKFETPDWDDLKPYDPGKRTVWARVDYHASRMCMIEVDDEDLENTATAAFTILGMLPALNDVSDAEVVHVEIYPTDQLKDLIVEHDY